jgi:hypothetical protein
MLSFNYPIHLEHVGRRLLGQVLIKIFASGRQTARSHFRSAAIIRPSKIQSRYCISNRIIALTTKPDTVTQKKVPILG